MSRWHITKEERDGLMFSDWKMFDADGDYKGIIQDEPTEADAIEGFNNPYGGKDGLIPDAVRGVRIEPYEGELEKLCEELANYKDEPKVGQWQDYEENNNE
jgi:hypothetical protein